ncbi:hypothetical protein BZG36_05334 [Bifiguratus adelaidae]|uniref:Alcohol dehydrogenase-like N-terminal domain-containing protein n=1 Tax=Bifiguratus adelaidae TaxID=1938954 RepID=A0A261XU10_9FUNG|nr:hypothetical protein BZG36_05334 [Bifiguratus adelaidae]
MTTYKAAQFAERFGKLEIVDKPMPKPGRGEVLVKIEACGVCHSDSLVQYGALGNPFPRVPGHEIIGTVYQVPEQFQKGVRVGSGWNGGYCGSCDQSQRGNYTNCQKGFANGISHDGGYQEYALLRQEALCFVPDGMDPTEAAPMLCADRAQFPRASILEADLNCLYVEGEQFANPCRDAGYVNTVHGSNYQEPS